LPDPGTGKVVTGGEYMSICIYSVNHVVKIMVGRVIPNAPRRTKDSPPYHMVFTEHLRLFWRPLSSFKKIT